MSPTSYTKAEQETVIRYDQDERRLRLYTTYPADARRWQKLGYDVTEIRTSGGKVTGWSAAAPLEALRLRRLVAGAVVKRRATGVRPPVQRRSEPTSSDTGPLLPTAA